MSKSQFPIWVHSNGIPSLTQCQLSGWYRYIDWQMKIQDALEPLFFILPNYRYLIFGWEMNQSSQLATISPRTVPNRVHSVQFFSHPTENCRLTVAMDCKQDQSQSQSQSQPEQLSFEQVEELRQKHFCPSVTSLFPIQIPLPAHSWYFLEPKPVLWTILAIVNLTRETMCGMPGTSTVSSCSSRDTRGNRSHCPMP